MVVAFDAGNLSAVADAIKSIYPDVQLIVAADNDQWNQDKGNAGVQDAIAVARKHPGTKVAIPNFVGVAFELKDGKGPTDFNDLMILAGQAAVRMQLAAADIPPAEKGSQTEADPIAALGLSPGSATGVDRFVNIKGRKGTKNGLHAVRTGEDGEPVTIWLCSPIEVRAIGRGFDNAMSSTQLFRQTPCDSFLDRII